MVSRRRVLIAVAVVVAAVVGLGVYLLAPRGTSEISTDEAVDDFRSQGDGGPTGGSDDSPEQDAVPAAGVYTFVASGEEVVKLGPLPAQTRPFPAEVTGVVLPGEQGCFEWTLNLFAEHVETTSYCVHGEELTLEHHTKQQQIGALSPTASMDCDPNTIPLTAGRSSDLDCHLTLSGGPASIAADLSGSASAGTAESVEVGGDEVTAVPVTIDFVVTGDLSGSWVETTWWGPDNLPVRVERSLDLQGPASFTENSRLDLLDLQPAT